MRLFTLIILFIAGGSPAVQAQENELPFFKQVTHPFMPSITSEYFFFSEDGLLWFSTAQGLTSFDGSELTYYSTVQQANSFGLSRISAIAEDKSHNFYITGLAGLFYYDRKIKLFSSLPYTFSDNHKQPSIYFGALYCDSNGLLYAGSINKGLFVYNPGTKELKHYNLNAAKPDSWDDRRLNTVVSFAAHATDSTKLWVGSFHGIFLFDKIKKIFKQHFEVINPGHYNFLTASGLGNSGLSLTDIHYDIQKMDVADDSTIWFNCWTAGFGKYNTRTGKVKLFLHGARLQTAQRYIGYIIPKFARLSTGKYLLGIYDDKTAIFDTKNETATYFNVTNNPYSEEQTRFVTNDRQGNVWLLQRSFLYVAVPEYLRLQSVTVLNDKINSFEKPQIRGIYFDTVSRFYYATFFHSDKGVYLFDSNFHQSAIIPTPMINNYFTYNSTINHKITKDGSSRFWTAGWENYVLLPGKKRFEPVEKIFSALAWIKGKGEWMDIITSRDGNILLKNNN